jgi:hypothetical protein
MLLVTPTSRPAPRDCSVTPDEPRTHLSNTCKHEHPSTADAAVHPDGGK